MKHTVTTLNGNSATTPTTQPIGSGGSTTSKSPVGKLHSILCDELLHSLLRREPGSLGRGEKGSSFLCPGSCLGRMRPEVHLLNRKPMNIAANEEEQQQPNRREQPGYGEHEAVAEAVRERRSG